MSPRRDRFSRTKTSEPREHARVWRVRLTLDDASQLEDDGIGDVWLFMPATGSSRRPLTSTHPTAPCSPAATRSDPPSVLKLAIGEPPCLCLTASKAAEVLPQVSGQPIDGLARLSGDEIRTAGWKRCPAQHRHMRPSQLVGPDVPAFDCCSLRRCTNGRRSWLLLRTSWDDALSACTAPAAPDKGATPASETALPLPIERSATLAA